MATAWIVFESERDVRAPSAGNTSSFVNESDQGVHHEHDITKQTDPTPFYEHLINPQSTLSIEVDGINYVPKVAKTAVDISQKNDLSGSILCTHRAPVDTDNDCRVSTVVDSSCGVNVMHALQVCDKNTNIKKNGQTEENSSASLREASSNWKDIVDHSESTRLTENGVTSVCNVQQDLDHGHVRSITPMKCSKVIHELYNPYKIDGTHIENDNFDDLFSSGVDSNARCLSLPTSPLATGDKQWLEGADDPSLDKSYVNIKNSSSCQNIDSSAPLPDYFVESALHSKLCKTVSDGAPLAPPIPPRDYAPRVVDRPRRIEIHPVVQNGQKRSSTHYWLLPDKQRILPPDPAKKSPEFYMNVTPPMNLSHSYPPVTLNVSDSSRGCYGPADVRAETSTARMTKDFRHGAWTDSTLYLLADEADMDTRSVDLPYTETVVEKVIKKSTPSYQSVVGHAEGTCVASSTNTTSMSEVKDMIDRLQLEVGGVTYDESYTALVTNHWNYDEACKYLKVEHLFCLAIANRSICRSMLERNNWDIEMAASSMLDLTRSCGKSPLRSPNSGQVLQKIDARQTEIQMNHDQLTTQHTSRATATPTPTVGGEQERKPSLSPRTRPVIETKENFTFESSGSPKSSNR